MMLFGEFFKQRRITLGKTLREFCAEHGLDPGNISKIERGRMSPPTSEEKLKELAKFLNITEKGKEWQTFKDLAFLSAGKIPEDLKEEELIERLPLFFRTIKGKKFTKAELDELINKIRES